MGSITLQIRVGERCNFRKPSKAYRGSAEHLSFNFWSCVQRVVVLFRRVACVNVMLIFFFFENLSVVFVTFLFRSTNGLFSDSVFICVSMLIWERDKKCACFALTKVFFVVTLLQRFLEYFMKDLHHKKTFQHTLKYIIIPIYISLYVFLKNITDSI